MKIPSRLYKGDTIGITCPAGYMAAEKAATCITTLQQWGYRVRVGATLGSSSATYFSGTDEERKNEMQALLDDKEIKAILCGRGGYGMGRIIDQLDFSKFKKNPKWIIGFSDITILHCHLFSQYKIASLHAPMAAAFNDGGAEGEYVLSLKAALSGKKARYRCAPHPYNKTGVATGKLVGGNLSLLAHSIGTPSEPETKKCILFIEDIGEYIYSTDRMLHQLKRAGKLHKAAAIILGGFTDVKDTDRPFGQSIDEVLKAILDDLDIPVCFHFPVSHDPQNVALKVGVEYQLSVSKKSVQLKEL